MCLSSSSVLQEDTLSPRPYLFIKAEQSNLVWKIWSLTVSPPLFTASQALLQSNWAIKNDWFIAKKSVRQKKMQIGGGGGKGAGKILYSRFKERKRRD